MKYRVRHRTEYTYSSEVENSLGLAHLAPRALPWQRVGEHELTIDPVPGDRRLDADVYGNHLTYFHVTDPHERLVVEARTEVEVVDTAYDVDALARPWESARPLHGAIGADVWTATEFAIPSPKVAMLPEVRDYAAVSFTPGRPIGEAVTDLMHRVKADFDYDSKATTVTSTVADVFAKRAGVCQDFAHLALSCVRSHGLAGRYVSGYLSTTPPPGKTRVLGADASHAWLAVWVPGSDAWLAIDPTNDQWAGERYVTVAWGRDYGDVTPVKGIIYTEAKKSTLKVAVDVIPETEFSPA
ncbi:MAG: hypothetical protein CMH36_00530 [Microbacterium sp.]|uniref:Transglutaminase-like domain-containing protein n=1 Tax=Microbacterium ginsengisoli TaxID=400772 RepID=A0A3C1KF46_9MICO|nr:hypothetical protein [Microbacterium sp.]MBN9207564.1 transglutaminase family protein [Microbacterium ginsengisoli]HAN24846.1 hypothetical protein [Microbacterium ginsengisoli]